MRKTTTCSILAFFVLAGATTFLKAKQDDLPKVPREFRSAWVATVANIDWPSKRTLSTAQQKAELIQILDKSVELNLNSLIFQVRPMCDALYQSDLEPWSDFLTGTMGKAPEPFYDPLEFIIDESHKRGIELHVWFNPYRARNGSPREVVATNHVTKIKPEIVRQYGDHFWLDPAEEETKRHTLAVILDVVRRYKVDGVHLDDYFYPYKSYAKGADFPDEVPWQRYLASGGKMKRDDWRRHHVNDFVERFYREVKKEKPLVKVGISPFGLYRPNHPAGTTGFDQYSELYADPRLWLNKGWVDYWTPQLYWPVAQEKQAYPKLLKYWVDENHHGRHIWPGNYTSQIGGAGKWKTEEIIKQIEVTRDQVGAEGNVHFSMVALTKNREGLADQLRNGVYAKPALVPASPWLSNKTPAEPDLSLNRGYFSPEKTVSLKSSKEDQVRLWVVYEKNRTGEWNYKFIPAATETTATLRYPRNSDVLEIAVSAVDLNGTEGPAARRRL